MKKEKLKSSPGPLKSGVFLLFLKEVALSKD